MDVRLEKTMKAKKDDAVRKISRPKADGNLEKAVKNVQHILKKKKAQAKAAKKKRISSTKRKPVQSKVRRPRRRGIVYVGHIPHGFYEEQMKDYFKQFGIVTRVRVARSRKTGKSRGYGYVEFLYPEVAQIAAESMNNYLMCGRLLKATYIPPEKQHFGFFIGVNWTEDKYPKLKSRSKTILRKNRVQNDKAYKKYIKNSLNKLSTLEDKLQDKGISIKFQPIDVPKS
ncbi:MKI67 FHA domain-interacting nucleolar phosphoprotein-like [Cataglyphis hispanica]|uniref:MKI67 FHA domain-interacting nucleolar phosphoprotein-like n=1 Tax=Cataglyphis hispanica TaxID=1086592 RepID=UPI00217F62CA|nr:MKI67 FHA domain-interacting nucleolar phosphoprotein-like [Cataglyphis hispanica]